MRGSVVKFKPDVITDAKNASVPTLMPPSARPVALLNERTRPLSATMNCLGPNAPIVSGGQPEQSAKPAAVKFEFTVCAASGESAGGVPDPRSAEHTSDLQSRLHHG